MNRKLRNALLALPGLLVLGAAIWFGLWYASRGEGPGALLQRLPTTDAVVIFMDFAGLRHSGLLRQLQNSRVTEEAEYRDFTRQTDFDYARDLDTAVLSVAPTGKYILARGRFDWKKLDAYAEAQGGACERGFCRMQGSQPDRRISFFPAQSDLLALAVSADDSAALRLSVAGSSARFEAPDAPLWVSIPASVLQSRDALPAEARGFAGTLARAESVVLSLVPEDRRFAVKLSVRCRGAGDASELAAQLTKLTSVVRQTFSNEHQAANPADLTGVLTGGTFRSDGNRVLGEWPIAPAFLENLLGRN